MVPFEKTNEFREKDTKKYTENPHKPSNTNEWRPTTELIVNATRSTIKTNCFHCQNHLTRKIVLKSSRKMIPYPIGDWKLNRHSRKHCLCETQLGTRVTSGTESCHSRIKLTTSTPNRWGKLRLLLGPTYWLFWPEASGRWQTCYDRKN